MLYPNTIVGKIFTMVYLMVGIESISLLIHQ